MRRAWKFAVLVCVAAGALAFSGSALAAFTPRLVVSHANPALGNSAETTISVLANQSDNSIAKITIYAPELYGATLNQPAGSSIGLVLARAYSAQFGGAVPIQGKVLVANQSDASVRQASIACTGTTTHTTVWMLALSAAGQSLNIPVFVDPAAGVEKSFASTKLQICLTSPDIPQSAGGAPLGAKLLEATMALGGVFTNPSSPGQYVWHGLFTPYITGTGTANPAGTVESRAIVPIPATISLAAKYIARTNTYRLKGAVREATATAQVAGVPHARVLFYRGTKPSKLKRASSTRANAKGKYATAGHLKPRRTAYFQARFVQAAQDVTTSGCAGTALAPAGCVTATFGPVDITSRVVAVRVRR